MLLINTNSRALFHFLPIEIEHMNLNFDPNVIIFNSNIVILSVIVSILTDRFNLFIYKNKECY